MDKIAKALAKLPKQHKQSFDWLMIRLLAGDFLGLDIVKLKGSKNIFRIKHGRLRIIFRTDKQEVFVLQVGLRSEKTYRKF